MNRIVFAVFMLAAAITAGPAMAQTDPAPSPSVAPSALSVNTTTIGMLLDNPAARAVFAKHLPEVLADSRINDAREMTLPDIVPYAPDVITQAKLDAIDTDLKALPAQ